MFHVCVSKLCVFLAIFMLSVLYDAQESIVPTLFTVYSIPAISGSLSFNSCQVVEISDFYPIFFNPTVDYVHQLKCSYEVAYPL